MNKQEAIERVKNIDTININDRVAGQQVDMVMKNQVLGIISLIDEPQKVVIPKFVAEWIEEARAEEYSLYGALEMAGEANEDWIFGNDKTNQEAFARAWLAYPNIEVEKEKLYTVEIPNPNIIGNEVYVLMKNVFKQVVMVKKFGVDWKKERGFQLTEAEIKKDFEPLFASIAVLVIVVEVLLPPDWFLVRLVESLFLRLCLLLILLRCRT